MIVTSSLGESIIVDRVYRSLLIIQGHVFLVDLMELLFHKFHVIVGIDW